MIRPHVKSRKKLAADIELESITITLPRSAIIELENHGIKSGRGGGNMSGFLEAAALFTIGMFHDVSQARDALVSLVRNDFDRTANILDLSIKAEDLSVALHALYMLLEYDEEEE